MNRFSVARFSVCVGGFSLLAMACADAPDPENEVPVDSKAGLYEVTLSGTGLMKNAEKEEPYTYCLKRSSVDDFAHTLVKNFYNSGDLCTSNSLPREGNAVAGELTCAADPKMARGSTRFVYSGAVAQNSVDVKVQMKFDAEIIEDEMSEKEVAQLKLGMKMMERARFVIEARRTGGC